MLAPASRRLRILLIAEACNPEWTSVPLVGYSMARAIAERKDLEVTLVTHVRNRSALEKDPLSSLIPCIYIDNEWVAYPLYFLSERLRGKSGLSWTTITAMAWPSYMVFEHQLFQRLGKKLRSGQFDLIHRLTPLTPTMGSPLASMVKTPMIAGPLNGGLPWPKQFPHLRTKEREWLVPLRNVYRLLPYYWSTYRHLAGVIAGSEHTASEIPGHFKGQRFYLPENGVEPSSFPLAHAWPEPMGKFRFLFVGRLVPYKGVDLLLQAMAQSTSLRQCELRVVGDGPERSRLEEQSRKLSLDAQVQFVGWVEHRQIRSEFGAAQAFAFPSLREFGGGVVVEAMASGLPCIVVNYGGPGELVMPECGIRLRMAPRDQLVPELTSAMERLAADPKLCRRFAVNAISRVNAEFTWTAKADYIASIYRAVHNYSRRAKGVQFGEQHV